MQDAKNLKSYRKEVDAALGNDFLRNALDRFAGAYRESRIKAFDGMNFSGMVDDIVRLKDGALADLDELFIQFKEKAESLGIFVHLAPTAKAANALIARIAEDNKVKRVVKSKSMTAEEIMLNSFLENNGLEVTETDLGEWIIQLRNEGPSHMVMPAIHLSCQQVAALFAGVTGKAQRADVDQLVKVARRQLRQKFVAADMGISGANFAIADTGAIGLVTNEGNARLVTTLPRVHVALVGVEKLLSTLDDALRILRILPLNATGQVLTSYVTWITGAGKCGSDHRKVMHIVFLDNGRLAMAKDTHFAQVLRCVRCGACANVCPVYRMVGGHQYGHIYIGAIGLILTYFLHGKDKARHLVQNCINCGACKEVCAAGIDLPRLVKMVHARILEEEGHPLKNRLLAKILKNRHLFHRLLRTAAKVQKPVTMGTPYLRHLPMILSADHNFRKLPAIASIPFRDQWEHLKPNVHHPIAKVALFSGCVQDFVYPEQLVAAVKILSKRNIAVDFPMAQSCCGLPAKMMGEDDAARQVARQNISAVDVEQVDWVVTLCASCASHICSSYSQLLDDEPVLFEKAELFTKKVIPFTAFLNDEVDLPASVFRGAALCATYHAPCHLCRGLGIKKAPHALMRKAGLNFVASTEEETCCGFGGTYSTLFPTISSQILSTKLDDIAATGASVLVTECPGCIMQLRGGALQRNMDLEVKHFSEILADRFQY